MDLPRNCHLAGRHERSPGGGFFVPDIPETLFYSAERFLEFNPGGVLYRFLEVEEPSFADNPLEIVFRESRVVEEYPGAGDQHIASSVMVRGVTGI